MWRPSISRWSQGSQQERSTLELGCLLAGLRDNLVAGSTAIADEHHVAKSCICPIGLGAFEAHQLVTGRTYRLSHWWGTAINLRHGTTPALHKFKGFMVVPTW